MPTAISKEIKDIFRDIASSLNTYVKSKDCHHFLEIENFLRDFFDASDIKFWYCNRDNMALSEFCNQKGKALLMDSSLTKKTIESKKILIENHITSNKYFNPRIDNPLELKVKSLLMFPVVRHKKVIGIVKIWRGMKQRNNFSKKDEESMYFFLPLFSALLELRSLGKEEIFTFIGEKENKVSKKEITVKQESIKKEPKIPSKDKVLLEELEKKYATLQKEKEKQAKVLKGEIERYKGYSTKEKDSFVSLKEELEEYKVKLEVEKQRAKRDKINLDKIVGSFEERLEEYKVKLKDESSASINRKNIADGRIYSLEEEIQKEKNASVKYKKEIEQIEVNQQKSITTLNKEIEDFKVNSLAEHKELEEELRIFKDANIKLEEALKVSTKVSVTPSIKSLRSQQAEGSTKHGVLFEENIEYLLEYFSTKFKKNEYSYSCFEMIIYALSSGKGMSDIEEMIKSSKVLSDLIDAYYFKGDLVVYNNRHSVADIISHLQLYEKYIFSNLTKLNITIENSMPNSLVFDRIKVQSILQHLLCDLHRFIDHQSDINIDISLENKYLQVELGGTIHKKNTLFNTMFKQIKLAMDNEDRVGLQLSRRVVERLKGNIEFLYANKYYKFIVTLPIQMIKL